ncbi:hypothetical protein EV401DRAFT_1939875 [Pisolithus croceorrhizus]|nr:hypothetical protein EV401DRAFT_1939875 [Pisolithus croceorrhizus]
MEEWWTLVIVHLIALFKYTLSRIVNSRSALAESSGTHWSTNVCNSVSSVVEQNSLARHRKVSMISCIIGTRQQRYVSVRANSINRSIWEAARPNSSIRWLRSSNGALNRGGGYLRTHFRHGEG